jgi:hypothetical protein
MKRLVLDQRIPSGTEAEERLHQSPDVRLQSDPPPARHRETPCKAGATMYVTDVLGKDPLDPGIMSAAHKRKAA